MWMWGYQKATKQQEGSFECPWVFGGQGMQLKLIAQQIAPHLQGSGIAEQYDIAFVILVESQYYRMRILIVLYNMSKIVATWT